MARGWRRDRGSRSVGDPSALAGTAEAWDEDEDDGGGFGRWGIVRQVASVVLVAAIIGGTEAFAGRQADAHGDFRGHRKLVRRSADAICAEIGSAHGLECSNRLQVRPKVG